MSFIPSSASQGNLGDRLCLLCQPKIRTPAFGQHISLVIACNYRYLVTNFLDFFKSLIDASFGVCWLLHDIGQVIPRDFLSIKLKNLLVSGWHDLSDSTWCRVERSIRGSDSIVSTKHRTIGRLFNQQASVRTHLYRDSRVLAEVNPILSFTYASLPFSRCQHNLSHRSPQVQSICVCFYCSTT